MAKLAQAKPHAASIPAETLARWTARARPLVAEAALPGAIVLLALFLRVYRMELEAWLPDTYEQLTASRNLVHGVFPPSDIYPPGVAVTMAPWAWGGAGLLYVAFALALGAGFLWLAELLRRDTTPRRAMLLFHYSLLYLALLFAALALDAVVA